MALTESEKTELKNDILNAIKAESQGVNELTEVTSLDNIKSLPALRGTELVSAPLTLLGKPATDAAATANAAATKANNAATNAAEATSAAGSAAPRRTRRPAWHRPLPLLPMKPPQRQRMPPTRWKAAWWAA